MHSVATLKAESEDDGGNEAEKENKKDPKASKLAKTVRVLRKVQKEHVLNYSSLLAENKQEADFRAELQRESWFSRASEGKYWSDIWGHVKLEARHYWFGAKLLGKEASIASGYLWRVMWGQTLSRRERKQFVRTLADLVRLVPFIPLVIIPGAELLLPVIVKFFPNFLPTQFRHQKDMEGQGRKDLRVRLEMAKFLQETVQEMAVVSSTTNKDTSGRLSELATMFEEGRTHARDIPTAELVKFSTLFSDELTLDNLSHAQLKAFCRLLSLSPIGPSSVLNFQIRMTLRSLQADDELILAEGISNLTVTELQNACRARGMRATGITEVDLHQRLEQWIHLHVVEQVPASLLLMSRVLYLPDDLAVEEQLASVLDSLPENLKDQVTVAAAETEALRVNPETKLKVLENEEALIEIETEEIKAEAERAVERGVVLLKAAAAAAEAAEQRDALDMVAKKVTPGGENEIWEDFTLSERDLKKRKRAAARVVEEEALACAADVATTHAVQNELEELRGLAANIGGEGKSTLAAIGALKDGLASNQALLEEVKLTEGIESAKGTEKLMEQVDAMIAKLEVQLAETQSLPSGAIHLDLNDDGIVSREELVMALKRMNWDGEVREDQIRDTVFMLDVDQDGVIPLTTIEKVVELFEEEGGSMQLQSLRKVVEMVEKEERLAAARKEEKK
jgi:LETM1 and EF-hand domain-containing protein 1